MAGRNLAERVEVLEMKIEALEELPARMLEVESQLVQLRTEVRGEFSAVRAEMRVLNEETKAQMRTATLILFAPDPQRLLRRPVRETE